MSSSIPLADDEAEATLAIVCDAVCRIEPNAPARAIVDEALANAGAVEIPLEHNLFHAFVSGALYDAFSKRAGDDGADALMAEVDHIWRAVSVHLHQARSVPPQPNDVLDGIAVLIVDDDALARRSLARTLPDFGAEVRIATDAASALEMLSAHRFDVVVVDYDMPGESGATLATMMTLSLGHLAPPVICLTGVTPLPRADAFHAVLRKPTHSSQLVAAIHDAHMRSDDDTT